MSGMQYKMSNYINADLSALPTAELKDVVIDNEEITSHKAITIGEDVITFVSKHYDLVQNNYVFSRVIEGVKQAGFQDFQYRLWTSYNKAVAYLDLILKDDDFGDSCRIGVRIANSVDRSKVLDMGFKISQQTKTLELVGYRQVCSNGMIMKVPLDRAEIVKPEVVIKLKELMSERLSVRHLKVNEVSEKIEIFRHTIEALTLLKPSFNKMIKLGREFVLKDFERVKLIVMSHVAERYRENVLNKYKSEEQNLWGLYNAMTYVASHSDYKETTKQKLLDNAAIMYNELLFAEN